MEEEGKEKRRVKSIDERKEKRKRRYGKVR